MVSNPSARMKKLVMGEYILVERECSIGMLLIDMDILRLMVYAQQIEESTIREIRQECKRPRSNDYSNKKHKKRFYHKDSSMGKIYRDSNQSS